MPLKSLIRIMDSRLCNRRRVQCGKRQINDTFRNELLIGIIPLRGSFGPLTLVCSDVIKFHPIFVCCVQGPFLGNSYGSTGESFIDCRPNTLLDGEWVGDFTMCQFDLDGSCWESKL